MYLIVLHLLCFYLVSYISCQKPDLLTSPKLKFALRYTWIRLSKCPFNSFSLHFFLSKANCWHPFLKHLWVFCYQTSNYYRCSLYDKPSSRVKTMYTQWGQILYKKSDNLQYNMLGRWVAGTNDSSDVPSIIFFS